MSDSIGRIAVPDLVDSGLTFPLKPDAGFGMTQDSQIVTHQFGSLDAKVEQRYAVGLGPRKFTFRRQNLNMRDRATLAAFWESVGGSWKSFTYNAPNPDQTATATKVTWEYAPLSMQYLVTACQAGMTFVEMPNPAAVPTYPVNSTCLRFPSTALQTALLSQVQQIIPLVRIRVREQAVADIYLSDRRCTVGGQLYLPRVLGLGEPGSDAIISQDIKGAADNVQFTFGNADRVMTALANDTDLKYAQIDLSLYHVNSGILLQLWSGFIVGFVADGSAQFSVRASDGLYQLTQMYPARVISRQCWKPYNDGIACPWATRGANSAAVTAAGGDPALCDYYFDSTNGCRVHGMQPWFGGHPAQPQGVNIKDNSTGTWGFGRSAVTATSIISDSIWGNALQEIWCNDDGDPGKAFWVTAMISDGRDESDFYDAIGIVGAGPIGAFEGMSVHANADGYRYIVAPMLDGQTPHGFTVDGNMNVVTNNWTLGLRESLGTDPTDQSATDDRFLLSAGGAIIGDQRAAGTAFVEIRRADQKGIQPTTTDQHQMQVPIRLGLTGWIWNQGGARTAVGGLTNPFWIAVNCLLRALGIAGATSTAQLDRFVLASLFAGDGSGAAEIADDLMTPVLGPVTNGVVDAIVVDSPGSGYNTVTVGLSGGGGYGATANATVVDGAITEIQMAASGSGYTSAPDVSITDSGGGQGAAAHATITTSNVFEKQFRFQGVLAQQKPFRDWLTEILACGLGFFTWEFGKLKLGCRINASATDAFTLGNMLLQSLRLEPVEAAFEHLIVDFADQAYQYQANTAEYQDKSHAAYYGRAAAPLTARQHLVGCATLSQALRLAAVRTREEIGGINPAEWRNARNASWRTTVLALNTEVGQVVSLTHPDVPGGYGDFRIQAWRLNKDWSIDITARTVTPSMYDLTVGPKPLDVTPAPLPVLFYPTPLGPAWAPYQVQAAANDALFPGEWTFDTNQSYAQMADGSMLANLVVTGKLPVNEFSATGAGAPGIGSIAQATAGGSLPANVTLRVAICAVDSNGLPSAPSNIVIIGTGAAAGGAFTLEGITWPAVAGLVSYVLFVATQDDLISAQATGALTAGPNNTYTPESITFGGPLVRSTWALPSPYVSKIRLKAKHEIHGGIIGAPVDSVSTGALVAGYLRGSPPPSNPSFTPVGRIVSIIGRPESATPYFSATVTSWDSSTGTIGVTPDPNGIVQAGDCLVLRYNADASNSANPTSITDSGCQNIAYLAGMTPGAEVGNLVRVIRGVSRGTPPRKIVANTATTITWDLPMVINPGDVWIIEEPTWPYSCDTTSLDNGNPLAVTTINMPTGNFVDEALVIAGFTVDVNGNESPDGDAPIRENWVFGAEGLSKVAGLVFQMQGTLGVESNAAQPLYLNRPVTVGDVKAYVQAAPTGSAITFTIYVGGAAWLSLTIPAGQTAVVATPSQIGGLSQIPANTAVSIGITAVGTTFPGSDLSVFIYS